MQLNKEKSDNDIEKQYLDEKIVKRYKEVVNELHPLLIDKAAESFKLDLNTTRQKFDALLNQLPGEIYG